MPRPLLSFSIHLTIAMLLLHGRFLVSETSKISKQSRLESAVFRRVRKVAKNPYRFFTPVSTDCLSVRLSVCPHVLGRLTLEGCPKILILENFIEISQQSPNWFKIGKNTRHFTCRPNYVLFCPATKIRHKNTVVRHSVPL